MRRDEVSKKKSFKTQYLVSGRYKVGLLSFNFHPVVIVYIATQKMYLTLAVFSMLFYILWSL